MSDSPAPGPARLTPMMERYLEVKRQTPGSLLLFRMGDFYELFHEDAVLAAKVLGLTLTSRDKGSSNPVPMAGFPYHALDGYLQKLIRSGHRAAICDQVEDPKTAKGMVRREVTRIVTPGTLTDDSLLDPRESNYLAAVWPGRQSVGVAWLELSTGRFQCCELNAHSRNTSKRPETRRANPDRAFQRAGAVSTPGYAAVVDELARLRPAECLLPEDAGGHPAIVGLAEVGEMLLTERPAWCFSVNTCRDVLHKHFGTSSLEGFDIETESAGVTAAGALLQYVQETQKTSLAHIVRLEPYRHGSNLLIDETSRRSLELMRTLRDGKREGSLLDVLDETATAMGARLLAEWLSNPLTDPVAIGRRLDAVQELTTDALLCREIGEQLKGAYDLQRLAARVATQRATPRDLASLAATLAVIPRLKARLTGRTSDLLQMLGTRLELCPEVRSDIEAALVDEPPALVTAGAVIRPGFDARLDELRELARGGKSWIARYQQQEIERTGIPSLKVGFNKVFGYYLEVTAANMAKVPADYIRKQTLKNQERYVTPELKEYEEKVLRAEEQANALEQSLFSSLRERVAQDCTRLQQTAETLAQVDVLTGLAVLAVKQRYCRPDVVAEPLLEIRDGRHPVLDRLLPSGGFVPNDISLHAVSPGDATDRGLDEKLETDVPSPAEDGRLGDTVEMVLPAAAASETRAAVSAAAIALITGPNMAGKSTYIRQAALLTVMAQIGSFVPAAAARIGIADRIFARVGASDELGKGQSTFMVEMTETARILNAASLRSLVILDEIGRGTSTYDGISLAWAITEYLHDQVCCRTLFATHYHELTDLSQTLPRLSNWNVSVHEQAGDVIFLHKIVPGAADRSYGIHVARLAGVPREVIERADAILDRLEADHHDESGRPTIPNRRPHSSGRQLSLFTAEPHPLLEEIRALDLDQMTPFAALQELHRMRDKLK